MHREDPIHVFDMERDKEWDNIEVNVCKPLQPHRLTSIVTGVESLPHAVPPAIGQTLGMTLRPLRGGCDGRCVNDGFENGWGSFLH